MWWNSNASSVVHLFQNKVMLLLKIMLNYDAPLLNGQPPLSGHLPVPQGWSALNGCSTLLSLQFLSNFVEISWIQAEHLSSHLN